MSDWGLRIKEIREMRRLSQAALAKACKRAAPSVSAWESGDTKMIEGDNLVAAAAALRVYPEVIMGTPIIVAEPLNFGSMPAYKIPPHYARSTTLTLQEPELGGAQIDELISEIREAWYSGRLTHHTANALSTIVRATR